MKTFKSDNWSCSRFILQSALKRLKVVYIMFGFLLLANMVSAQAFSYDTPRGELLHTFTIPGGVTEFDFTMDQVGFSSTQDGIMFDIVNFNYSPSSGSKKLITLSNAGNKVVDIIGQGYTVKLRRYLDNSRYYDYLLYDSLFQSEGNVEFFNFRLYFTASFFWFQVDENQSYTPSLGNYFSPVYWGINYQGGVDNMHEFLTGGNGARVELFEIPNTIAIHHLVKVYHFDYQTIRQHITSNLSEADAPALPPLLASGNYRIQLNGGGPSNKYVSRRSDDKTLGLFNGYLNTHFTVTELSSGIYTIHTNHSAPNGVYVNHNTLVYANANNGGSKQEQWSIEPSSANSYIIRTQSKDTKVENKWWQYRSSDNRISLSTTSPSSSTWLFEPVNGGSRQSEKAEEVSKVEQELKAEEVSKVEQESNAFSIYPNPTNGVFQIDFHLKGSSPVYVELLDLPGKVVHSQKQQMSAGNQQISLSQELAGGLGVYILNVTTDFFNQSQRVILE